MYKMEINRSNVLNTKYGRAKINNNGHYQITTSKEDNNGKYLHRLIFEDFYGKIPKGYDVHHDDENPLNNCIINLKLMSHNDHLSHHHKGKPRSDETRKKISEALTGDKHPKFNPCLKIRKRKKKDTKQGFEWIAQISISKNKRIGLSSVDLDKCVEKVEKFIKSEKIY